MDRLTGKDAKLMMEAVAAVYMKEEVDQEVISEEVEVLDENRNRRGAAARLNRQKAAAEEDRLYRAGGGDAKRQETRQMQGASRARVRRPGMSRAEVIELGRKNLAAKASTSSSTGTASSSTGTAPAAPANNAAASKAPAPKPAANPNVTSGGTKFERRLPTMAELRAAQAARKAAPKVLSRSEIENRAVTAGVNAGKPTVPTGGAVGSAAKPAAVAAKPTGGAVASAAKPVAAAAKPVGSPAAQAAAGAPNRKEDLFTGKPIPSAKPAPAGGATAVGSAAAKPAPAGSAAAGSAGAAAAPVVKKKPTYNSGRQRARMEEVDIFDTIKEYLIGEGATEEEALKQMLILTDEERTEILEGSCGSKRKKKGGYKK